MCVSWPPPTVAYSRPGFHRQTERIPRGARVNSIAVVLRAPDHNRILCPCDNWPVRQGESNSSALRPAVTEDPEPVQGVAVTPFREAALTEEISQPARAVAPAELRANRFLLAANLAPVVPPCHA